MKNLIKIQNELKAPKNQRNNFGNYNYRNAEDILEAVKPLLNKYECLLTITDEIVQIGDRFYIKATGTFVDGENQIVVSALARESLDKKGQDASQVTGATSSYARKYMLNGLFLIDDTKDADSNEYKKQQESADNKKNKPKNADTEDTEKMERAKASLQLQELAREKGLDIQIIAQNNGLTPSSTAKEILEVIEAVKGM